jgi:hypothetical protein
MESLQEYEQTDGRNADDEADGDFSPNSLSNACPGCGHFGFSQLSVPAIFLLPLLVPAPPSTDSVMGLEDAIPNNAVFVPKISKILGRLRMADL